MTVAVLCLFKCVYRHSPWQQDAVMIHVASSAEIIPTFEALMQKRHDEWNYVERLAPRPLQWRLTAYVPANGERVFNEGH